MKPSTFLAGVALFALMGGQAYAACVDEIARLSPGTTTGSTVGTTGSVSDGRVSKDGSTAPLQSSSAAAGQPNATGSTGSANQGGSQGHQGIAKDGSTMPLANQPGGGNTNVATSQQDVQAQQRGGQPAATAGQQNAGARTSGTHSPEMMAALDRARTLQQQGNEAGCMQAVQDARRLQQ